MFPCVQGIGLTAELSNSLSTHIMPEYVEILFKIFNMKMIKPALLLGLTMVIAKTAKNILNFQIQYSLGAQKACSMVVSVLTR